MPKFQVTLSTKDIPFNGTSVEDITIVVPAETMEAAREKGQRSAEYFAKYAGKNAPVPQVTVTEVQ